MKTFIAKLKKVHLSKTVWVNMLTGIVYVSQTLSGQNIIPDKYLIAALTLANIALRFITNEPLETK